MSDPHAPELKRPEPGQVEPGKPGQVRFEPAELELARPERAQPEPAQPIFEAASGEHLAFGPAASQLETDRVETNRLEPDRSETDRPRTDHPETNQAETEKTLFAPQLTQPEKSPFWGYNDLLLFMGLAPVCLLLGYGAVKLPLRLLGVHPATQVEELLPEQLIGYVFLFGALAAIFRQGYGKPFWTSLGWTTMRIPPILIVCAGIFTGLFVVLASNLIHLPDSPNQITELMETRTAILLMALFGTTIAPVCEELAFRGFLQPLLVRSLGAAPGILLAAIPFGLLHYQEYGNSWRHVLIISAAGGAFGVMRQVTGSTRAAALMHASYNALFFLAMLSDPKDLPQTW